MAKEATTNTKQARKYLPKKQGWKTVLYSISIIFWTGVTVIASQFIVGYSMLLLLGQEALQQPLPTAICSVLSYVLSFILMAFIPPLLAKRQSKLKKDPKSVLHIKAPDREGLGLEGLPTWTDIGLAPVGFIVYLIIAGVLTALFSQFTWFNASEIQDVGFSTAVYGVDRLVAFLILVVAAPVAEELIFRGWLYGKLRQKLNLSISNMSSMTIAALLVSILFGFLHGQWNVGVNVFAMSLVLCVLREITGTIYAGILLHMLKNGIAFYLLFVIGMR